MSENCPIKELLDFLKEAIKDKNTQLPESLSLHAKECKACHNLLCSPNHWKAFVRANEEAPLLAGELSAKPTEGADCQRQSVTDGQVWKIDFNENEDAVMGLVTDTSSLESDDFVRIAPIFVTPNSKDIDEQTDMLLRASQMPNGLPCMIEWWNDRPVETSYLTKCYGKIDEDLFVKVKERIIKPIAPQKISKSVFIFRESEKAKGDLLSASIIRKIIEEEKAKAKVYSFSFEDMINSVIELLNPNLANEELAMAAATNDISDYLDKYLKQDKAKYYVLKLANNTDFTIASYDRKSFDLKITYENNEEKIIKSNQTGKVVVHENDLKGIRDFEFTVK